ncbi:FAD-binding and (Fe-S)-binding domain-containing protein [soil metagenome]
MRLESADGDGPAHESLSSNDPDWPVMGGTLAAGLRDLLVDNEALIRSELPHWPRRVSGYALDWLLPERGGDVARSLVGTEGTCAVIAGATIRLVRPPAARCLLVLGFPDDIAGAHAVPALLQAAPFTVESLSIVLLGIEHAGLLEELLPKGAAWLLVEAGGDSAAAARDHAACLAHAVGRGLPGAHARLLEDSGAQAALWRVRADGAGHASRLPDGRPAWPGFEDSAVPPARLAAYLGELHALLRDHGLEGTTYGHFGEGCIHLRVGFGLDRPGGERRYERFIMDAADLVVAHGGTLSGEHGDGRARSVLLSRMFSARLIQAFARFKAVWDPTGVLNPGVIADPPAITEGLRATAAAALDVRPVLAFHADGGDFRSAVGRCVGVGKCVSTQGSALMCPSYRATRDERHSTRGRARLLQEMVAGSLSADGWRSQAVREALDLCLACKGCVSECPTAVDIATLKSEFLHHHYRRRVRPRSHYSLGWLPAWLLLTHRLPTLVNLLTRSRLTRTAFALVAGIASERSIPPVAPRSFVRGHAPSAVGSEASRGRVVLWQDTFNNYLTPEVAHAAARVLAAAGFDVSVPRGALCCGLTWVTTGQLDVARRVVGRTLAMPSLSGDEPIVVLEPSCAALLRADLPELLPDDARALSLSRRITTLGEILDREGFAAAEGAPSDAAPTDRGRLPRPALVQPHCHQQAILGMDADRRVLDRSGVEVGTVLDGCCGLAGNFGAERGHEATSLAVAALALLPALESIDADTPVLADGFSCRAQIEALSSRRARHLAEVLADRLPPRSAGAGATPVVHPSASRPARRPRWKDWGSWT